MMGKSKRKGGEKYIPKMPRMPSPDQQKMGTQVFKDHRQELEEAYYEPGQCGECDGWDLLDDEGYCSKCGGQVEEYKAEKKSNAAVTLLIDDLRIIETDVVARTFDEGLQALQDYEVSLLYLDHDLGSLDVKETGYDIVCWLEQNPEYWPQEIIVITANPVGRQNIYRVLEQYYTKHPLNGGNYVWKLNEVEDEQQEDE